MNWKVIFKSFCYCDGAILCNFAVELLCDPGKCLQVAEPVS